MYNGGCYENGCTSFTDSTGVSHNGGLKFVSKVGAQPKTYGWSCNETWGNQDPDLLEISCCCKSSQYKNNSCTKNLDCGTDKNTFPPICDGNNVISFLYTYTCESGKCNENVTKQIINYCPNGCLNGACTQNNQTIRCYNNLDCGTDVNQTYCSNDSRACTYTSFHICQNPGTINSVCMGGDGAGCGPVCPNGCLNGACIQNPTPWCNDSDGGKNYYVKGTTIDSIGSCGGACYDSCYDGRTFTPGPGFAVAEWYCENNTAKYLTYNCQCNNGICTGSSALASEKPSSGLWSWLTGWISKWFS